MQIHPRVSPRAGWSMIAVILALAADGCGGSAHAGRVGRTSARSAADPICTAAARTVVARFLGVAVSSVSVRATTANSGAPECDFAAQISGHRAMKLSVEVDTAPQPYAVLERAAVEASQIFGPKRLAPAPQNITRLGLDADWFPEEQHLMTTDGVRLITATVAWPSARQSHRRALAQAAARTYLGRLRPDLARGPAP